MTLEVFSNILNSFKWMIGFGCHFGLGEEVLKEDYKYRTKKWHFFYRCYLLEHLWKCSLFFVNMRIPVNTNYNQECMHIHSNHDLQALFIGTNRSHKNAHMCNLQLQKKWKLFNHTLKLFFNLLPWHLFMTFRKQVKMLVRQVKWTFSYQSTLCHDLLYPVIFKKRRYDCIPLS